MANPHENDQPEDVEVSLPHPSYDELVEQLNKADAKVNEHWDTILRIQADFENYKKRAERDIKHAHEYANERYIREFLDVFDSIEHSIIAAHAENADLKTIQKGLELISKMLHNMSQKLNLKSIEPMGQPFNPSLHEAMNMEESEDYPPNTVIRVLQKGYQLHDRVVRPARVTVSKAKT